jgi:glycosyltransferase involved in cell wall biosynthesis
VQVFFPSKLKTTKYAGNWDPSAKTQPKSYKVQKWLLSHTFLTKNMTVLVYGQWQNQTKNIKSFFTATYRDIEKPPFQQKNYTEVINFLFVGSLVEGKRPLFAIKMIEQLHSDGIKCCLEVFGDGVLREELQAYIELNQIDYIKLHGNQTKEVLKKYLSKSHFSILASKSEGWPKAIAEAMFFGVIPISTRVSCVPFMLDNEARGILIDPEITSAINRVKAELITPKGLQLMAKEAQNWSQNYTLDYFESEIKKLLS